MKNLLPLYYPPFLCNLVWFMLTSKICEIHTCISLNLLGEFCLFRTICCCSFHDFSHYPFDWLFNIRQILWCIPQKKGSSRETFPAPSFCILVQRVTFSPLLQPTVSYLTLITLLMCGSWRIFKIILFERNLK